MTEDVVLRHVHVIEEQLAGVRATHAQLVELVAAAKACPFALDDERSDAMGALFQIGLGIDDVGVGVGPVGDPRLAAVEHIVVAAFVGAQFHRHHVRPGIGFAHRQGADVLAADQLGQVLGLLRRRAVTVDLVDAQIGVGTVGQRNRGRGAADLFHRHYVCQITQARAAVFFRHGDAEQAHVAELAPHVGWEQVVVVDLRGARGELGGCEGAHLVAKHVDGLAQGEVQAGVMHARAPCCS